ncbi:chorismate--pyruvate lyase family protein [Halorhodospira halochloris]|uniref:chorismate--pyruvate lyase family protein n=1 Tax=Halorhodospira halochloris TaxID=1052 RepID=UPI001EE9AA28|nr:chorismate lyase [Halorhodospira halochloris]MCG5547390.1 chorismate lyase [Halorhodospira halochloris]
MDKRFTQRMRWQHRDARWRPSIVALPCRPPVWVRELIAVKGSLTAQLERFGNVEVTLLWQGMARPSVDEALALGEDPRRWVWLREVILNCTAGPRIYARSVMPRLMPGPWASVTRLGAQPLGRLIFAAPDARRGPLAVARLQGEEPLAWRLYRYGEDAVPGAWARRSTLMAGRQSILVTEVFLAASCREVAEGELASR